MGDLAGELTRQHPDLVGRAIGDLRQCLQILVGEHVTIGLRLVDCLDDLDDGLGLTLGTEHGCLRFTLGTQDRRRLGSLCGEDGRLLLTLRRQNGSALIPLGAHLLFHRLLHAVGGVDRLELDPVDPDAPLAGRLVQDPAQLGVDAVPRGEGLLQIHGADHIAQCCDG